MNEQKEIFKSNPQRESLKAESSTQKPLSNASARGDEVVRSNEGIGLSVISGIKSVSDAVSEYLPKSITDGTAGTAINDGIKVVEDYIKGHEMSDIAADFKQVVKRNPIPAVLLGVGIGFLVGTTLNRR